MKKKLLSILTILFITLSFLGCKGSGGSSKKGENFSKDASYALGMNIGKSMAADNIYPNMNEFVKGMKDALNGSKTRMDDMEAMMIIQAAFETLMQEMEKEAIQQGVEFLAENSLNPNVVVTASGLQYEIVRDAEGPKPTASDTVYVHYEGRLLDGTVFDSSYRRGVPADFPVDGVIPGWTEGLLLMNVGSHYKFYIPSELGYGPYGGGPIPPNATLIFDVELIEILEPEKGR